MEKYSKDMINAYINGDVIEEYSVEELENDNEFMKLVIDETNDKNMYKLCSDNVKVNDEFVRYVIKRFKDDNSFVSEVADKYIKYLSDLADKGNDVSLIKASFANFMINECKDNKMENMKYNTILAAVYSMVRVNVELKKKNKEAAENVGLGFDYFKGMYGNDDDLLSYFAERMVKEIVDENKNELDDMLHSYYESFADINDLYGDLLEFIDGYDKNLVNYLNDHMMVLADGAEDRINIIKKNWNQHEMNVERRKYNKALDAIHEIVISNMDAVFAEEALLIHFGDKYGIVDKIAKYSLFGDSFVQLLRDQYSDVYFRSIREFSTSDRDLYNQVEGVFKKVLK